MKKAKAKTISSVILNTLLYIFLAICIFSVFVTTGARKDSDGTAEIFGYQMRVVTSNSMEASEYTDVSAYKIKDIPLRSMVFVETIPSDPAEADEWYRSLQVGDVLTFRYVYTTQVTITHRIISPVIEKETGGFIIELAGDNKSSEDGVQTQVIDTSIPNNTNYVIGKVTGQSYLFGAVMSFLMQPIAIVLVIIVPCFIIILFESLKISNVLKEDKKKQAAAEIEKKESELDELRRKLAELEMLKKAQATAQEPAQPQAPPAEEAKTAEQPVTGEEEAQKQEAPAQGEEKQNEEKQDPAQ